MQSIYQPVGRCIYCPSEVIHPPDELSDEHIIALSLGGTVKLSKASCVGHAELTSQCEESVAGNLLGDYRNVNKFPSRRPELRKRYLPVKVTPHAYKNLTLNMHVTTDEFPALVVIERFLPPGIMVGAPEGPYREGHYIEANQTKPEVMDLLLAKFHAYSVEVTSGGAQMRQYARMLAKVGHVYATAELGYGNFEALLPRVIEGQCEDELHYVGCLDFKQPQKDEPLSLWQTDINGVAYHVVAISLKSLPMLPRYDVVVGRVMDQVPFPERSAAVRAAIEVEMRAERKRASMENPRHQREKKVKVKKKTLT